MLMQVDWLPPIHAHVYATCNCFDHTPHLEKFWNIIRAEFKEAMKHLPVLLTGKGADGDPRERCMTLQLMYSRWREKHHPRLASFSAPLNPSSVWVDFPGSCNPKPAHQNNETWTSMTLNPCNLFTSQELGDFECELN